MKLFSRPYVWGLWALLWLLSWPSFAQTRLPLASPNDVYGYNDCGDNLGFEDGDLSNWDGCHYDGNNAPCCPVQCDIVGLQPGINSVNGDLGECSTRNPNFNNIRHTLTNGNGIDPNSDNMIPVVAPGCGNYSVRIGNQEAGKQAECMSQTFTVVPENALFTYMYAVVFQDPTDHTDDERPRFNINISASGAPVPCGGEYVVVSKDAINEGFTKALNPACGDTNVWYKPWTPVATDLTAYIGQQVTIEFCTADCGRGGHWGYAYVDTYCSPLEIDGAHVCSWQDSITLVAPQGFTNYEWYMGTLPLTPPIVSTDISATVPVVDGDVYTVRMENVASPGCYTYITDTIVVFGGEAFGDTMVCKEFAGPIQLTTISNDGDATYNWTPATGLSCTTCPNPQVNPPYSDIVYTVTMTNAVGCIATDSVVITTKGCDPTVTATADSLCNGGCGEVTAVGSKGLPPYTYTWSPDVGGIGEGPHTVCPTTTTVYHVTITDADGYTDSTTATFVVYPLPTVSMPPDETICANEIPTMDLTATVNSGTAPFSYLWDDPSSGTTATITISNVPDSSVTYHVTVTDVNGCSTSGEVTITSICLPEITMEPDEYCVPDCAMLDPKASKGTPPYTYTWDDPTLNGPGPHQVCPSVTTTYCVTVTDVYNKSASTCATITVHELPVLTTSTTDATCGECNGSVVVNASGNAPFNYLWSSGCINSSCQDLCAGPYTVTVSDVNDCVSVVSDTVIGHTRPTVDIISSTDPLCFGDCTGTATAVGDEGISPYTFTWNDPGQQSGTTATGLCAGTHEVCLQDDQGCLVCDSVVINQPPALVVSMTAKDEICHDSTGAVYQTSTGGVPPYTFVWSDQNSSTTATITMLTEGTYEVTITDSNGCTATGSDQVINNQILPSAEFVPDPVEVLLLNPVINFFDKSSDAISWYWDFGDGAESDLQNPIHLFTDTGCYQVLLRVENKYGCTDSIPRTVCVKDLTSIYVPNAFTPNGDGTNEYFTVGEYNYCEFEMFIYDRWGNMIFKTTSMKGWDGTANNGSEIAQQDVYVWLIKAVDCYGEEWQRVGRVTLVR
ncbi:MAG: gliding motility-associated C-terminal domain-containing protein [Flavobacteriales bacterium]|nr:gliding motility-associated C-terminal domain-containing protein [Flavobacteriales bacterium]